MTTGISVATAVIDAALDLYSQNHKVIANNIANAQTTGFGAKAINFDQVLSDVKQAVINGDGREVLDNTKNINAQTVELIDSYAAVDVDEQMVELTSNTLKYQALVDIRNHLGSIKKIAITGSSQ